MACANPGARASRQSWQKWIPSNSLVVLGLVLARARLDASLDTMASSQDYNDVHR